MFRLTAAPLLLALACTAVAAPLAPHAETGLSTLLHARLAQAPAQRTDAGSPLAPAGSVTTWIEQKTYSENGIAFEQYGSAVAVDGTTAVIGGVESGGGTSATPPGPGVAYILEKGTGGWVHTAELRADDGANGDLFGGAVALLGDTAVITSQNANLGALSRSGAAYVFQRSSGTWTQVAKLTAADAAGGERFGISVAIDGDTIVVGAYGATVDGHPGQGALYVFSADGGGWTQTSKLIAINGIEQDQLGFSVALHGDVLMAGAPNAGGFDDRTRTGAVYVFERSGGVWSQVQKLSAADGVAFDNFGITVAFEGDQAVVGAPFATALAGAAYVFEHGTSGWTQTQRIDPESGQTGDMLWAFATAISGDRMLITQPMYFGGVGRAAIYDRTTNGWVLEQMLTASDAAPGANVVDNFGLSATIVGDTILIGQPNSTIGTNDHQGAAYFYDVPLPDTIFADGFDAAVP